MSEQDLNRAVINAAGELRSDQSLVDRIPITDAGPVLTGALLEGLPGPCDPVPQPIDNAIARPTTCSNARSARSFELVDNITADYLSPAGSGRRYTVWSKTVKVVRNAPFRVFFDFTHPEINAAGVSIVHSQRQLFAEPQEQIDQTQLGLEFAAWFEENSTVILRDTRSNGGSLATSGNQISRFGVDDIGAGQGTLSRPVLQLFDVDEQRLLETEFFVGTDDPTPLTGQNLLPIYSNESELRVDGYGFIQTTVNCSRGEYVTVFVIADTTVQSPNAADSARIWQVVLDYEKQQTGSISNTAPCDEANRTAPSRAYQQGAVVNEWVGGTQYGYFGQTQRDGETVGSVGSGLQFTAAVPNQRFVDNIYYPYEAPPVNYIESIISGLNSANPGANLAQGYFREGSRWSGATGVLPNVRQTPRFLQALDGVFSMPSPQRTVEIKGYFRAPVTGNYEFFASASDGLWMWLSSDGVSNNQRAGVDDLGIRWDGTTDRLMQGGEFFVQDGFTTGDGNNYGRNNYVLRVGPRTANITGLQSNGIRVYLKEDSYYFVRILSGATFQPGFFQIEYQIGSGAGSVVRNNLTFGGRSCSDDAPAPYQEPIDGGGGGVSVISGPAPGGSVGVGGGGAGPIIDLFGAGGPLPWWWGTTPANPDSPSTFTDN